MVIEIKERYNVSLSEFLTGFGLEKEFEKVFGSPIKDWDYDMYDLDVIELLLDKYREESNYIIFNADAQGDADETVTILEI
tara:strand:- start:1680 stop:1922 length:243 start_codon:yes stop_codon:yes gene_type:complete